MTFGIAFYQSNLSTVNPIHVGQHEDWGVPPDHGWEPQAGEGVLQGGQEASEGARDTPQETSKGLKYTCGFVLYIRVQYFFYDFLHHRESKKGDLPFFRCRVVRVQLLPTMDESPSYQPPSAIKTCALSPSFFPLYRGYSLLVPAPARGGEGRGREDPNRRQQRALCLFPYIPFTPSTIFLFIFYFLHWSINQQIIHSVDYNTFLNS